MSLGRICSNSMVCCLTAVVFHPVKQQTDTGRGGGSPSIDPTPSGVGQASLQSAYLEATGMTRSETVSNRER